MYLKIASNSRFSMDLGPSTSRLWGLNQGFGVFVVASAVSPSVFAKEQIHIAGPSHPSARGLRFVQNFAP